MSAEEIAYVLEHIKICSNHKRAKLSYLLNFINENYAVLNAHTFWYTHFLCFAQMESTSMVK